MNHIIKEVCASSINSVLAATIGGADRIELCQALPLGGLTPSEALISFCHDNLSIPVFVLIRPREGNFVYNEHETSIIMEDINNCRNKGVDGVVVGFPREDGRIDSDKLKEAVCQAGNMSVTFILKGFFLLIYRWRK